MRGNASRDPRFIASFAGNCAGVFASNPTVAKGAAEALIKHKTNKTGDKINLVGFDSDDQLVKFLKDGTIGPIQCVAPKRR